MMGLAEHLDDAIVIASAELRQHAEDLQTMKINERHTPSRLLKKSLVKPV